MLDISTLGAGGGSIASVGPGGMLRVGPQSAGALPGPACYGRGGVLATVTDANLLLGYLGPRLGSALELSRERAHDAVAVVARSLGVSVEVAAAGIHATVNAAMTDALRLQSAQRGLDPRRFALIAAGGAGPLHAAELARGLGIALVLVPRAASVLCAWGMLLSDFVHHDARTVLGRRPPPGIAELEVIFRGMEANGERQLELENVDRADRRHRRSFDLHYVGQVHELEVDLPTGGPLTSSAIETAFAVFQRAHRERFGHVLDSVAVEIVEARVQSRGIVASPPSGAVPRLAHATALAVAAEREAWFAGRCQRTPVHQEHDLAAGDSVIGPALVEMSSSTIVVPPSWTLTVEPAEHLALHPSGLSLAQARESLVIGGVDG
jgi:N-methylhydantoinase A